MKKILIFALMIATIGLIAGNFYCYASSLELDYKVIDLKTLSSKLEHENNKLKESVSEIKDPAVVKEWAENNSFVEIIKVEYFNLNTEKTIVKK